MIWSWQMVWGGSVVGQRPVRVKGAGSVTGVWGMEMVELFER